MNCPNCNHPIPQNGKFCPVCGTPVVTDAFSSAKTRVMEDTPPTQEYVPAQPYESAPQAPRPAAGASPQQYGDPFRQPAGYQPPAAPDAYDYQPPSQQQGEYDINQPQQNNYSEQFRQYQQPSQYGASNPSQQSGNPNGKPNPPKKNNMPLIIVLIVLGVLLVGGAIFAVIMIVNSAKGGNQPATSPTAAVTTTVNGSSSQAQSSQQQSSQSSAQSSQAQSSAAQSSQTQSSSAQSSQQQSSQSTPYSGSHTIKSSSGVVLAEADSIHADDSEAEAKLKKYMTDNDVETSIDEDDYSGVCYIKGNAVVYELTLKIDLTDAQKQTLQTYLTEELDELSPTLKEGREESGVDDMVIVYAYLGKDGSLVAGGVCDK